MGGDEWGKRYLREKKISEGGTLEERSMREAITEGEDLREGEL